MNNTTKLFFAFSIVFVLSLAPVFPVAASGTLPVSDNDVYIEQGETEVVQIYPPYNQTVNVVSISDTSVVTAYVDDNQVLIYGRNDGNAWIELSTYDNYTAVIYVTVGEGDDNNDADIEVSPTSLVIGEGETDWARILGGYSTYRILSNSNDYVVDAWISGDRIYVRGLNEGSASIRVYANDTSNYATLRVTVSEDDDGDLDELIFSSDRIQLRVNDTHNITVFGPDLDDYRYYIYRNTNSNVVSAYISGDTLRLTARSVGSATIDVRTRDESYRGSLHVTVYSTGSSFDNLYFANGTLVLDNGTVYITYKNTKTGFANEWSFLGLGYNFASVVRSSTSSLSSSGYTVTSQFVAHPWGSWIKMGNTVYFVHDDGLIPIPSYSIFLNNGGRDALVVPANSYDFNKPVLSIMTWSDSRLD